MGVRCRGLRLRRPVADDGRPRYVIETRPATNEVVVGPEELLSRTAVDGDGLVLLADPEPLRALLAGVVAACVAVLVVMVVVIRVITPTLSKRYDDQQSQAAEAAASDGVSLEVVDLRSLSPLDLPTITDSVKKTGRAVIVHEAQTFAGLGAEIAARVQEECFYHLEAPVLRVGGYNIPYPPSRFEEEFLPTLDRVLDAVDRSFEH